MEAVRRLPLPECELGEGCMWDMESQSLYFVDITACTVFCLRIADNRLSSRRLPGPVGCVVPEASGKLLAAAGHSLYLLDKELKGDGKELMTFDIPASLRFNDGKCDPWGRLWVGTMAADQSREEAYRAGSLLCVKNGCLTAEYGGYTIPNGMAWSADQSVFYHTDTQTQKADRYGIGGRGELSGRRAVISIPPDEGSPDGMCMDAEGNLWIALWGAGEAACYDPRTGKKEEEIPVPARNVSCVTFGGPDMQTFYITTAKDQEGQGGALYSVRLPVKGLPPFAYRGTEHGA